MNRTLEPIETNERLWLEMFADDELEPVQIERLFGYLDQLDGAWKRLALTMIRERRLGGDVRVVFGTGKEAAFQQVGVGLPLLEKPTKHVARVNSRDSIWLATLAACIAFVLGALSFSGYPSFTSTPSDSLVISGTSPDRSSFLPAEEPHDNPVHPVSFSYDLKSHTIYEIENTPTTATYYLRKSIPELLLQSLVLAGHSVELGQDFVDIQTESGEQLSVPISTLRIEKFAGSF